MVENHPLRRPLYGRAHAAARTPNERQDRARARRAAEALFAPKPSITEQPVDPPAPAAVPAEPAAASIHRQPPPREIIPAEDVGRIRTWVKYGMSIRQVAAVYGIEADEIIRILRSPSRDWTKPT